MPGLFIDEVLLEFDGDFFYSPVDCWQILTTQPVYAIKEVVIAGGYCVHVLYGKHKSVKKEYLLPPLIYLFCLIYFFLIFNFHQYHLHLILPFIVKFLYTY